MVKGKFQSRAGVAQLAEHGICNPRVEGSSPSAGSIFPRDAKPFLEIHFVEIDGISCPKCLQSAGNSQAIFVNNLLREF